MADQIYNASCGFFNAVNDDRKYTAEQMNLLYDRVIADGVFATPQGTPSNDLQVFAGAGMNISVTKGAGIFAHKWFRLMSNIMFTVPGNTSGNSRIDSVIVQVDTRNSGRCGNVVYRQGEPSATPAPPSINLVTGVTEYRVANIAVASMATAITQSNITDLRGSSECLWVTSLIQQVDTSTLWEQYNAAYKEQFYNYQGEFEDYIDLQRQAWEEFLSTLTSELTVTTDMATYTSSYTSLSTISNVPINIPSFNYQTDVLHVYINGLYAASDDKYTLNENHTSIDLVNALDEGNTVYFVVFKSLIGAGNQSVITLIEELNYKINSYFRDSGWVTLTLENGATAYDNTNPPQFDAVGHSIYLRGSFKNLALLNTTICTLPVQARPEKKHTFVCMAGSKILTITIFTSGLVQITNASDELSDTDEISICTNFMAEIGWS